MDRQEINMIDITENFKIATTQNVLWFLEVFYNYADKLRDSNISVLFDELEDNWAVLVYNERTIGYLWRKYAVLFVEEMYKDKICQEEYLQIITSESLTSASFRVDYQTVSDYFENNIDFSHFSPEDLWFSSTAI